MRVYETKDLRNIGIVGHGGCGKTTLVEAMAFNAGYIDRMGKIEEGSTISDYDPEEIKRHISISTSSAPLEFGQYKMNVLDVPGYFDFIGEMIATLKVADSAVILIDAVSGVEVGTEKACSLIKDYNIPSIFMINKMDRENADFKNVLGQLRRMFGNSIVPFEIPIRQKEFKGIINIVEMKARERKGQRCVDVPIPKDMKAEVLPYREMIVEAVAQTSEELLEKYFNGEELSNEEIYNGLRKGVLERDLIPVVCGSAILNIGVETFMKMLTDFFPSPGECQGLKGKNPKTDEMVIRQYHPLEPFSAQVFKTIADPYVGKLSLFKIISGSLTTNDEIYNATRDKQEKSNHIYVLNGRDQQEVKQLMPGDIGAFSKLQDTVTGDTLCDPDNPVIFDGIKFPEPMIAQAIFPKSKGDEDKLGIGLKRLNEEDPSFKIIRNEETKETLISGLGEMHLEIIGKRLYNTFAVEVELKDPKIPYRETIKGKATVEGKHKKQSGGRGQYGHVFIDLEPIVDGKTDFEFVDKVVGGAVPRQLIPAVEKGLKECIKEGVLARYPVTGVRFTLHDGSFHPVDSDEMSFKMAASLAYKKGMKEANSILLEPIYQVEICIPNEYMGDIMGDINKKRGRILGVDPEGGKQKIIAEVPLVELSKYATELRSLTRARGEFTMKFICYEEVPDHLSERIIENIKKGKSL